jgi:hypothetical protein
MNKRFRVSIALLGLGIVALGAGCSRSIVSRSEESNWVTPPPATSIQVTLNAPTGGTAADIQGTRVLLLVGSSILRDTTLASVTTAPFTFTIGSLPGIGTYQIAVTKTGFTLQASVASITGSSAPRVSITLRKIENSNTISIVNTTISAPSLPTTITVSQPPAVTTTQPTSASLQVTIPANSGLTTVAVSSQTATEVPSISTSKSVVSAVQIQTNATTTSPITVNFPLPITSSEFAGATGGKVDVLRLNTTTLTWEVLGQATIGADGTAAYTVSGLTDTNTILSIGATPKIAATTTTLATTPLLTNEQITNLITSGQTTVPVPLDVSMAVGKPTRSEDAPQGPSGIDPAYWQMMLGTILANLPDLANYFRNGTQQFDYDLPTTQANISTDRRSAKFTFTYTFGGISRTYSVLINYNHINVKLIGHSSGTAG